MSKESIFIDGPIGQLEAVIHHTDSPKYIGIICHPNPLQSGTMDNKVVTTVARAFNALNITAIRFNYRGVGQSAGSYGEITGEVSDAMAVVAFIQAKWPNIPLCAAGFSFGAYIAASISATHNCSQLISIAPAVDRMPYANLRPITCPWLVIQGEQDEVVDPFSVYKWYDSLVADKTLIKLADTGHYFHGKLPLLQNIIQTQTRLT